MLHTVGTGHLPKPLWHFPYAVFHPDRADVALSDTLGDVIGVVIGDFINYPDYHDNDEEGKEAWRFYFALQVAAHLTRQLYPGNLPSAIDSGADDNAIDHYLSCMAILCSGNDITQLDNDGLTVFSKRVPAQWVAPFPIVLMGTDYEPYTSLKRPRGEALLIDPYDDERLIASLLCANGHLARAGLDAVVHLYTRPPSHCSCAPMGLFGHSVRSGCEAAGGEEHA